GLTNADLGDDVARVRIPPGDVAARGQNLSEHRAAVPEVFGDRPGVHTEQAGDVLLLEPVLQGTLGRPVADVRRQRGDHEATYLDPLRLEPLGQAEVVPGPRRHPVVADVRVGENQNLTRVGRVGQRLRV